jgi:hypothetical protein
MIFNFKVPWSKRYNCFLIYYNPAAFTYVDRDEKLNASLFLFLCLNNIKCKLRVGYISLMQEFISVVLSIQSSCYRMPVQLIYYIS